MTHQTHSDLHSAAYFGADRDFWWNQDFLDLMAKRWDLKATKRVLDVGCGVGHWGRTLARFLPRGAEIVGVDREQTWVSEATKHARALKDCPVNFSYRAGVVEELPFDSESFDMVTCQTVLIHVRDVKHVLREMLRVVRPGGLLAVAEPNNLINALVLNSVQWNTPIADVLEVVEFKLACERGKEHLGEGNNSIGELIPGFLSQLGAKNLQVYTCDKVSSFVPPYASDEEQAHLDRIKDWTSRDFWLWTKEQAKKYYLASGNDEMRFDRLWQQNMAMQKKILQGAEQGTLHRAGGCVTYLISATKDNSAS